MAKSLANILDQITRLQKEATAMQQAVIVRIRKEIAQFKLTQDQLFGDAPKAARGAAAKQATATKKKAGKGPAKAPKFADEAGNTWGGMGKRPEWLREALAAGRSIEEFRIAGKPARAAKATKAVKAVKAKPARTAKATKTSRAKPRRSKPAAEAAPPAA